MPTRKAHPQGFYPTWKRNHSSWSWGHGIFFKNPLAWENQKPLAKRENVSFIKAFLWFCKIQAQAMLNELVHFGSVCVWQDFNLNVPNGVVEQLMRSLEMKWSIIKTWCFEVCRLSSWIVQTQITKGNQVLVCALLAFAQRHPSLVWFAWIN